MIILNIIKRLVALIMALFMNTCLMSEDSLKVRGVPEKSDESIRIISQNVRYNDDAYGSVENRSKLFVALVRAYEPDSFGVQEATPQWMEILERELGEEYGFVSQMRDESEVPEASAVFYKKDKYDLVDSGTIWLSDTPEVPYSKLEIAGLARVATWAVLRNRQTGQQYTHINTHLDNAGDEARTKQAEILNTKIDELLMSGNPLICTGDFNDTLKSDMYAEMTKKLCNARLIAQKSDFGKTYHDYGNLTTGLYAIDFIFVTEGISVDRYKVIDEQINGMYVSDHYGIMADINL
ncbi:MAG: endonuclease/exonuclease/phosphatase family protein [Clostridia bacterium]|nr:endonuclease/exonuclease/phosphatase family protein [Clostridia bacterium]